MPNGPIVVSDGTVFSIKADTSMTTMGKGVEIRHQVGTGLNTSWTSGDGTEIKLKLNAKKPGQIGKVTSDGFIVTGYTADGKSVILSKYSDDPAKRFLIEEKIVARKDLRSMGLHYGTGGITDKDAAAYLGNLQRALRENKGVHFYTPEEVSEALKGKSVLSVMSASRLGQLPSSVDHLNQMPIEVLRKMVAEKGPENVALLWGGTDSSKGEIAFVKEAEKLGVKDIFGFSNEGIAFNDVNAAKKMVIVGGKEDWLTPIKTMADLAGTHSGLIISEGGGNTVKTVQDYALNRGYNVTALAPDATFLAEQKREAAKIAYDSARKNGQTESEARAAADQAAAKVTGGASAELAMERPDLAFHDSKSLIQKIDGAKVLAKPETRPLKIGVYTGSFDPPHAGHQAIIEGMKKRFGLDVVYVVPDKVVEYKPGMQSLADRNKMVAAMLKDNPSIKILTPEMQAALGKGQMWDVVNSIKAGNPGAKLYNIMGTDTYQWYSQLPQEHRPSDVTILVNNRDPKVVVPEQLDAAQVYTVDLKDQGFSSTKVRAELKAGQVPEELPSGVMDYIRSKNLYNVPAATAATVETAAAAPPVAPHEPTKTQVSQPLHAAETDAKLAEAQAKRKARDEMFNGFAQTLPASQKMTYEELVAAGKKMDHVVVLGGYSGQGYENPAALRAFLKDVMKRSGEGTMYVIGSTKDGIGAGYEMIPEIAKELGYKNIKTAGIVSRNAVEFGLAKMDYNVFVDTTAESWDALGEDGKSLMVKIAKDTNGQMFYAKGGPVAMNEINEAVREGVPVTVSRDPALSASTDIAKAKILKSNKGIDENSPEFQAKLQAMLKAADEPTHTLEGARSGVNLVHSTAELTAPRPVAQTREPAEVDTLQPVVEKAPMHAPAPAEAQIPRPPQSQVPPKTAAVAREPVIKTSPGACTIQALQDLLK